MLWGCPTCSEERSRDARPVGCAELHGDARPRVPAQGSVFAGAGPGENKTSDCTKGKTTFNPPINQFYNLLIKLQTGKSEGGLL